MKMKRKIIAIWIILLLIAIPFSIAQASETYEEEQNNENISIEIAAVNEDGSIITEIFTFSEEEIEDFESTITNLMDAIQSATSLKEIENILENIPTQNGIFMSIFSKLFSKIFSGFQGMRNRGFVISHGHSFKLNPFKKNSFKIRKKSTFWHYSNGEKSSDRTIIFKPVALKMNILSGRQFGRMSNFLGIYIFIAKRFPQKSITFFMGTARRINGREFL
jgi:hypothetical protein